MIDVLAYLQDYRHRLAGNIAFRTLLFVALPGASRSVLDADQLTQSRANGLATLRELDRFVNGHETVELNDPGEAGPVGERSRRSHLSHRRVPRQHRRCAARGLQPAPGRLCRRNRGRHLCPRVPEFRVDDRRTLPQPAAAAGRRCSEPLRQLRHLHDRVRVGATVAGSDLSRPVTTCSPSRCRTARKRRRSWPTSTCRVRTPRLSRWTASTSRFRHCSRPCCARPRRRKGLLDPATYWLAPATGGLGIPESAYAGRELSRHQAVAHRVHERPGT